MSHFLKRFYRFHCGFLLLFCFAFGLVMAFVMPPFQVPDEDVHWLSATSRFSAFFRGSPGCSVAYALPEAFGASEVRNHPEVKGFTGRYARSGEIAPKCDPLVNGYGSLLTYPGALLGRALSGAADTKGRDAISAFYLSRVFQGLLIVLVMGRAFQLAFCRGFRAVPGTAILFALGASPLFLQQSFGVSADAAVNAFGLYSALMLLYLADATLLDLGLFGALGLFACLSKPVILPLIVPLAAAASWIHRPAAGSGKRYSLSAKRVAYLALAALLSGVCLYAVKMSQSVFTQLLPGRDPGFQLQWVKAHPLDATALFARTVFKVVSIKDLSLPLGWRDLWMSGHSVWTWVLICWVSLLADAAFALGRLRGRRGEWRKPGKHLVVLAIALLGIAGSVWLTCLTMFMFYSAKGQLSVEGLQSRYFFVPWVLTCVLLFQFIANWRHAAPGAEEGGDLGPAGALSRRVLPAIQLLWGLEILSLAVSVFLDVAERYH